MNKQTACHGDLGHNATVYYRDSEYITNEGEPFYCEEVSISDKTKYITLIPKEALSLLKWLEQEKPKLERLAKETQA
jgi:hypothetical protein